MADDNDNSEKENSNVNYVRKKNIIPGIDNDHLILAGLGILAAITAAPHAQKIVESFMRNIPQNQFPPNGVQQQQPVYLPPAPQQQPLQQDIHLHQHEHAPTPMEEHEQAIKDQKAYEAAMEKESVTGSQSITMVPDRSTQVAKNKSKGNYEAGSNISGSYS